MKKSSKKFKQLQRERILKTKPWLKSTGPKTEEGKVVSKMNALKIDTELHRLIKEMKHLVKQRKEIFDTLSHNGVLINLFNLCM